MLVPFIHLSDLLRHILISNNKRSLTTYRPCLSDYTLQCVIGMKNTTGFTRGVKISNVTFCDPFVTEIAA
jgi:hypothetical protein